MKLIIVKLPPITDRMLTIPASSTLLTADFLQWTLLQQDSATSAVRHCVKNRPVDEAPSNCFASLKTY